MCIRDRPSIDGKWKGIGIRIEDDVLVNEEEPEILSIAALKEISDLESWIIDLLHQ